MPTHAQVHTYAHVNIKTEHNDYGEVIAAGRLQLENEIVEVDHAVVPTVQMSQKHERSQSLKEWAAMSEMIRHTNIKTKQLVMGIVASPAMIYAAACRLRNSISISVDSRLFLG